MSATWESLTAALAGTPDLSGARCAGRSQWWDEVDDAEIVDYTRSQCQTCPALTACAAWLETLPPRLKPCGVVAGKVIRKRAKTSAEVTRNPDSQPTTDRRTS